MLLVKYRNKVILYYTYNLIKAYLKKTLIKESIHSYAPDVLNVQAKVILE